MTRRRVLLLGSVAVVAAVVIAWALWPAPNTAITRATAAMVHKGMTQREVATILGGTPRDENQASFEILWPDSSGWEHGNPAAHRERWVSEECAIDVWFQDDRVIAVYVGRVRFLDSLFVRVWGWLDM